MSGLKVLQLPKGLRFLERFEGGLTKHGINFDQYRLLVAMKFNLGSRNPTLSHSNKPSKHPFLMSTLGYLLMGVITAFLLMLAPTALLAVILDLTTLFVFFFLTMLTGFSSVMLDPRDQTIFASHGVGAKTLNAARFTVVISYFSVDVLTMAFPGLLVFGFRFGLLITFMTLISIILLGLTTLTFSLLIYLLVLRFFDGERLKNVLLAVQVIMMAGIYAAGQLPNLLPHMDYGQLLNGLSQDFHWYVVLLIPLWFIGPAILAVSGVSPLTLGLTVLSFMLPVVTGWFYFHFSGDFERYLSKLDESSQRVRRESWYLRVVRNKLIRPQERHYFTLAWQLLATERDFKLRVYPLFAYLVVIMASFSRIFISEGSTETLLAYLPYTPTLVFVAIPMAVKTLQYSHQPQAMTLFKSVPFAHPADLISGTLKALYFRFVLPIALIIGIITAVLTKGIGILGVIGSLLILYVGVLLLGIRVFSQHVFPFATPFTPENARSNSGEMIFASLVAMFGVMALIFAGGFFHFWLFDLVVIIIGIFGSIGALQLIHQYRFDPQRDLPNP